MITDDDYYRLRVVRRLPIAEPADLEEPLDGLVRALARRGSLLFEPSGLSPAMQTTRVLQGKQSLVHAFLSTSEIKWNFGREPSDPTHEIVLFNTEHGPRAVVLRLSFVAYGAASTAPGLVAELTLGPDAAGPADNGRGEHLDELFSMLLAALRPDHGHVKLPGHPEGKEPPDGYDVGWITYFSRAERPMPPDLCPPAVSVPTEAGAKIFATPALALERYADVAAAIERVREQVVAHSR